VQSIRPVLALVEELVAAKTRSSADVFGEAARVPQHVDRDARRSPYFEVFREQHDGGRVKLHDRNGDAPPPPPEEELPAKLSLTFDEAKEAIRAAYGDVIQAGFLAGAYRRSHEEDPRSGETRAARAQLCDLVAKRLKDSQAPGARRDLRAWRRAGRLIPAGGAASTRYEEAGSSSMTSRTDCARRSHVAIAETPIAASCSGISGNPSIASSSSSR
jgi:hypothetical protein